LAPHEAPLPPEAAGGVNTRLQGLIPNGKVAYGMHPVGTGDFSEMMTSVMRAFLAKVAPPPPVLARAQYLVGALQRGASPSSVTYILKHLPMGLCLGWQVVAHPAGGGPPSGGYAVGGCSGQAELPSWASALPTIPPSSPSPSAAPVLQRR
jgi:hypothetical protein